MEKVIESRIKNHLSKIDAMFEKINEFDRIAVFRHDHPDYDALGSQMGMVNFVKENYPNKEVIFVGDDHVTLTGICFPEMMHVDDSWFEKPFLAIIVDLSNLDRVADERCKKATFTIKIDHHPEVEHYGDIEIVEPSMIAAGELIASIFVSKSKFKINKDCAENLYKAIVGDSGRFMYSDTSVHTFFVAQKLLETGINISKIYNQMYNQNVHDLQIRKFILDNFKLTRNGVAYYVLTEKELKEFNLLPIQGKDNINMFAHFNGINAWVSCTEDKEKGHWRISIRSAEKSIEEVATKYNGGGHPQACGCKIPDLQTLDSLIADLDALFE